ncbi:MAG TPA: PRC-barrel domain-containing protein, partial [Verrucomicrobiae bacterium]|nr:PRC-barrel domain-containing protein [Verrucomicrobiae bacterium]
MKKGRDFLGLPIIDPATGERLGEVVDLVMESAHQEVSGLLIDKGNWLHLPKQMLTSTIQTVQT